MLTFQRKRVAPWWQADDDCEPLRRVQLTTIVSAELPIIRMEAWRGMRWPDRPHP